MTSTLSDSPIVAAEPPSEPKRRVCFSFAAYAKAVVELLRASGTPVDPGLSEAEMVALEAAHRLDFPPDLRAILREGLPLGPGFPDWRSSPAHQFRLLLSQPLSIIAAEAARGLLWPEPWGVRPANPIDRATVAKEVLSRAPPLVPIYRHFYMPCAPGLAGNPVFLVRGGEVRLVGLDIADFFRHEDLRLGGKLPSAAWAAKSARHIDFWSDLAELSASSGGVSTSWRRRGLEGFVKEMGWVLRDGGWREEEVREMMNGSDDGDAGIEGDRMVLKDRESVLWHVRLLSLSLLRAGWNSDDVRDCMGDSTAARAEEGKEEPVRWPADPIKNDNWMELFS